MSIIKSNVARAVFQYNPEVKNKLWGGELWTDAYYVTTVSTELTEKVIANYVRNQGNRFYKAIVKDTVYQS